MLNNDINFRLHFQVHIDKMYAWVFWLYRVCTVYAQFILFLFIFDVNDTERPSLCIHIIRRIKICVCARRFTADETRQTKKSIYSS